MKCPLKRFFLFTIWEVLEEKKQKTEESCGTRDTWACGPSPGCAAVGWSAAGSGCGWTADSAGSRSGFPASRCGSNPPSGPAWPADAPELPRPAGARLRTLRTKAGDGFITQKLTETVSWRECGPGERTYLWGHFQTWPPLALWASFWINLSRGETDRRVLYSIGRHLLRYNWSTADVNKMTKWLTTWTKRTVHVKQLT